MTKLEALDKFCIAEEYATKKIGSETKVQFYQRRIQEEGKKWALTRVRQQVILEREATAKTLIDADINGLDI